jgi:hypothetical protein
MDRELIKRLVIAVVAQFKLEDFIGEITETTKLENLFGQCWWHTNCHYLVGPLMDEFGVEITVNAISGCVTVGDLINVVVSAIKDGAEGDLFVEPCLVQGPSVGKGISGELLAEQFNTLPS